MRLACGIHMHAATTCMHLFPILIFPVHLLRKTVTNIAGYAEFKLVGGSFLLIEDCLKDLFDLFERFVFVRKRTKTNLL